MPPQINRSPLAARRHVGPPPAAIAAPPRVNLPVLDGTVEWVRSVDEPATGQQSSTIRTEPHRATVASRVRRKRTTVTVAEHSCCDCRTPASSVYVVLVVLAGVCATIATIAFLAAVTSGRI